MILADIDVVGYATVALGILTLFAIPVAIDQLFELRRRRLGFDSIRRLAGVHVGHAHVGQSSADYAGATGGRAHVLRGQTFRSRLSSREHKQIELQFLCEAYMDLVDTVTEQRGATPLRFDPIGRRGGPTFVPSSGIAPRLPRTAPRSAGKLVHPHHDTRGGRDRSVPRTR